MFKCIFQIVLFVFVCQVHAADFLPLYDGAEQIEQRSSLVENHHIGLSKNKKIDGRWQFEREQKLTGILVKRLYEITSEDTYADIARFYIQQMTALKAELQFHCAERECGSSNEWANSMFRDSRLYGPDNKQYYWAIHDGIVYWAIYLIERGNKQVYLYVEQLHLANVSGKATITLQAPCLTGHDAMAVREFATDKNSRYWLFYSVAGLNTVKQSEDKARECAVQLTKQTPGIQWQAVGAGEFEPGGKIRVLDDEIELVRMPGIPGSP